MKTIADALHEQWRADLFRIHEDRVPFGPDGPGRDIGEAWCLARIELSDRLTMIEVAS